MRAHLYTLAGYSEMEDWCRLTLNAKSFVRGCRPFQLGYRDFCVYCLSLDSLDNKVRLLRPLGRVLQLRPTALFLFWLEEDWQLFVKLFPTYKDNDNCINCDDRSSLDKIAKWRLDKPAE